MAKREFLNLLARTSPANKVPFIYMSDHDVGAWQIYRTLRYGFAREAWLSASQCVPKLESGGVTTRQFLELIDDMRDLRLKVFAKANKDWASDKCQNEAMNWVQ